VPVLLAPLAGPILAGTILNYLGWPWLFYVNLPVGILAVVLAAWILPHERPATQKRPFDLTGFLMISPALVCLLYGFEQSSHHGDIRVLVLGVVLLGAFLRHSHRKKSNALIDIELFKIRDFSTAATTQLDSWVHGGGHAVRVSVHGIFDGQVWLPRGRVRRGAPEFSGDPSVSLDGFRRFLDGTRAIGLFVRGMGQGATGIPSMAAAYASVPREKLSLATMAVNIVQRLGAPTVTTVIAITVSLSANVTSASAHAFLIPFAALIMLQLLVLAATSRLPVRIHQEADSTPAQLAVRAESA
jgi:hypothetical protein